MFDRMLWFEMAICFFLLSIMALFKPSFGGLAKCVFMMWVMVAGKLICSIYITAVHSSIRGAKASKLYPQCLCHGKGNNDSF